MKKIVVFAAVALINIAMASCSADGFPGSDVNSPTIQNDSIGGPGPIHLPPPPPPPKNPVIH